MYGEQRNLSPCPSQHHHREVGRDAPMASIVDVSQAQTSRKSLKVRVARVSLPSTSFSPPSTVSTLLSTSPARLKNSCRLVPGESSAL